MNNPVRILVLERDADTVAFIAAQLPKEYDRHFVTTTEEAERMIGSHLPDLFLCADDLSDESGLMFLARTRDKWPSLRRILMVPDPDGDLFFTALKEIPHINYLSKPLEQRSFHRMFRHVLWESASTEEDEGSGFASELPERSAPDITTTTVVVLETNPADANLLLSLLPWGFRHKLVTSPEQAETLLDNEPADLLLCADDLSEESGLMFLARTRDKWPSLRRILMVPVPDPDFFFLASREMPILSYLSKPVKKQELMHLLRHANHDQELEDAEEETPREEPSTVTPQLIRIGTWALLILICAILAVGAVVIIYQIKCRVLPEGLPSWLVPDFLER